MLGIKLAEGYCNSLDATGFKKQKLDVLHKTVAFAGSQIFDNNQVEVFYKFQLLETLRILILVLSTQV
ncbi:hypothetical protein [Gottfriedia acidiceleris]|uniref:hypothetical protein n=1 Tax=Gottfriedia acidiceleris TaxID=371036 RepID=UPI00101B5C98|nr:hypothetical protein [Gottfriedia acidiceleris]